MVPLFFALAQTGQGKRWKTARPAMAKDGKAATVSMLVSRRPPSPQGHSNTWKNILRSVVCLDPAQILYGRIRLTYIDLRLEDYFHARTIRRIGPRGHTDVRPV